MRAIERTLIDLKSTYDGQAWHGTPLRRILDGIDHQMAHEPARVPGTRTIAQLLGHVTAWIEIVERRAGGEKVHVTPEMDFPDVRTVHWNEQIERLERAHRKLIERVKRLSDEDLDEMVEAAEAQYSIDFMLRGLVHHTTYHAAQIALLKKR